MSVTYCRQWNSSAGRPGEPMSEDEARARFAKGPWFTVVLDGEDGNPRATVELQPEAAVAKIFRYTPAGSIERVETHERHGDRLFLANMVGYEYADEAKHARTESVVTDTFRFGTDGVVRRITNDKSRPDIQVEDRADVDVEPNWRPAPAFGEWENLVRQPA